LDKGPIEDGPAGLHGRVMRGLPVILPWEAQWRGRLAITPLFRT